MTKIIDKDQNRERANPVTKHYTEAEKRRESRAEKRKRREEKIRKLTKPGGYEMAGKMHE